jgi:hypothetical protein
MVENKSVKMHNPSADRNKGPIAEVLKTRFPFTRQVGASVLEIGSGTGQHVSHLGKELNVKRWQPTEYVEGCNGPGQGKRSDLEPIQASINAYCDGMDNVVPCIGLDASAEKYSEEIEA